MRAAILLTAALLIAGCGHDQQKGAAETDTIFGDVSKSGQTVGQGRIDSGGGATAGGFPSDSITNTTEPGTGLQQKRENAPAKP